MAKLRFSQLLLTLLTLVSVACTKSDSGNGDARAFSSDCGTVQSSALKNPVDVKIAESGVGQAVSPNLVLMGRTLIKLHGISAPSELGRVKSALALMNDLIEVGDVFLFRADPGCAAQGDGADQVAIVGQVFSADGRNFGEELLKAGFVDVEEDDVCRGFLLASCYRAIKKEVEPPPSTGGGGGGSTGGELEKFLWKPMSDSDGKLAVHLSPAGTVNVAGEEGSLRGPGNGYAELARFSKTGCAYGESVSVRLTANDGTPITLNGSEVITIPNGCNRYCLEGGQIVQCVKR